MAARPLTFPAVTDPDTGTVTRVNRETGTAIRKGWRDDKRVWYVTVPAQTILRQRIVAEVLTLELAIRSARLHATAVRAEIAAAYTAAHAEHTRRTTTPAPLPGKAAQV